MTTVCAGGFPLSPGVAGAPAVSDRWADTTSAPTRPGSAGVDDVEPGYALRLEISIRTPGPMVELNDAFFT